MWDLVFWQVWRDGFSRKGGVVPETEDDLSVNAFGTGEDEMAYSMTIPMLWTRYTAELQMNAGTAAYIALSSMNAILSTSHSN